MRPVLALGLLMALSAPADAAGVHHKKPPLRSPAVSSQGFPNGIAAGGSYAAPRPDVRYDDPPSYRDPSKFGGGAP
jgi:hypothetical protein